MSGPFARNSASKSLAANIDYEQAVLGGDVLVERDMFRATAAALRLVAARRIPVGWSASDQH